MKENPGYLNLRLFWLEPFAFLCPGVLVKLLGL